MKTIAILFVAFCAAVISASAQTNSPISTRTINLTAEQYFVIKEYVLKDAAAAPQSESIPTKIGERIPTTITLRAFPSDLSEKISSLKSHVFYVYNGKIVTVDNPDFTTNLGTIAQAMAIRQEKILAIGEMGGWCDIPQSYLARLGKTCS